MQAVQAHGCGAILYLRQEGRGIGLTNKIRAYALQDQGHDTLDANLLLGLPADARTYEMCKEMLEHVDVTKLSLMTNNPNKVNDLKSLGLDVVERVPLIVGVNPHNQDYLNVKDSKWDTLLITNKDTVGNIMTNNSNTTAADFDAKLGQVREFLLNLQERICTALENQENQAASMAVVILSSSQIFGSIPKAVAVARA